MCVCVCVCVCVCARVYMSVCVHACMHKWVWVCVCVSVLVPDLNQLHCIQYCLQLYSGRPENESRGTHALNRQWCNQVWHNTSWHILTLGPSSADSANPVQGSFSRVQNAKGITTSKEKESNHAPQPCVGPHKILLLNSGMVPGSSCQCSDHWTVTTG